MIERVYALIEAFRAGELGGGKMPEDENPGLASGSVENYMYFTLPMALNYQRNSYTLWACANKMYAEHPEVFDCHAVCAMDDGELRDILVKYKVALQPNKQPVIWKTLCQIVESLLEGDIRNLFWWNDCSVIKIKAFISAHKKEFPYLGGEKICNYWLYVMEQYTDIHFIDRENISVAPDTHVLQASVRLGLISEQEAAGANARQITAQR